jgi:hypothetical protein
MTYASPAWEFAVDIHLMKLQRLRNKVLRTIATFQGAHRFTICTWRSKARTHMINKKIMQATSRSHTYNIMMRIFALLDKAKPDIQSIRGLNFAAVRHTTVQVT